MLLTTLLAAAALHASNLPANVAQLGAAPVLASGNTAAQTAEGIEILRRILVDTLDQAFEEKREKEGDRLLGEKLTVRRGFQVGGLVTTLWAGEQTVQHSRAFHMPEVGLFFALDAALPVVAAKESDGPAKSDQPTNDEWERTRRELHGDLSPEGVTLRRLMGPQERGEIDPKAIEQVTDLVLRTLARHVGRIEGLAPNEAITIALHLSGRNHTWLHDFPTDQRGTFSFSFDEGENEDLKESQDALEDMKRSKDNLFSAYVLGTGHEAREQNLVIRISLADLTGLAESGPERLRQRAQINRY